MRRIPIKGEIITNDAQEIYDFCGIEATCPQKVANMIKEAQDAKEDFVIEISSGGGSVFAGVEIYSMLKETDCRVEIVGIAASAASIIACGGKIVAMTPAGQFMIHNARNCVCGDKNEMETVKNILVSVDEGIAAAYMTKCGRSKEELLDMMDKETWLSAEKAKEYGFVDEILYQNKTEPKPEVIIAVEKEPAIPPKMLEMVNNLKTQIAESKREINRLQATIDFKNYIAKIKEEMQ